MNRYFVKKIFLQNGVDPSGLREVLISGFLNRRKVNGAKTEYLCGILSGYSKNQKAGSESPVSGNVMRRREDDQAG